MDNSKVIPPFQEMRATRLRPHWQHAPANFGPAPLAVTACRESLGPREIPPRCRYRVLGNVNRITLTRHRVRIFP